jgi:RNA polymerase-binding protein DksA
MSLSRFKVHKLALKLDRRHALLLEELRDALEKSANRHYVDLLDNLPGDVGDQSVADALADLELTAIDRHIQELRDIEAARVRIKERLFGSCCDCGAEIGYDRLLAYPTAKRCLDCQRQRERVYAHEPTPTF